MRIISAGNQVNADKTGASPMTSFVFLLLLSVMWSRWPGCWMTLISCHMSGGAAELSILNDLIQLGHDHASYHMSVADYSVVWTLYAKLRLQYINLMMMMVVTTMTKCTGNNKAVVVGMKLMSINCLFETPLLLLETIALSTLELIADDRFKLPAQT